MAVISHYICEGQLRYIIWYETGKSLKIYTGYIISKCNKNIYTYLSVIFTHTFH